MIASENAALIHRFYTAFAAGDIETMVGCYDDQVIFYDPAFGELRGERARKMWRMLHARSKGNLKITYSKVHTHDKTGTAYWVAEYVFGKTGRKVVNHISASFEFRDGKIVRHTDYFDLWKWSMQSLGVSGLMFGWTEWMQKKIRKQALEQLDKY